MSGQVIAAGIAAIAAVASAVVAAMLKFSSDRKLAERKKEADEALEKLRDELSETRGAKEAQRDYEYEARKRLYTECQPLLFQLAEQSDSAYRKICEIAESARQGYLEPDNSWFKREKEDYFPPTIYRLFGPAVIFRLLQRRLTIVDLSLEPHVRAMYFIAKQIYLSWNSGWELAQSSPRIDYDPWDEETPQSLRAGNLDQFVNSMIVTDNRGNLWVDRCVNYGEFLTAYFTPNSDAGGQIERPLSMFELFHPSQRPVLWRILLAQAHLYRAVIESFQSGSGYTLDPADAIPRDEWSIFALTPARIDSDRGEDPDDRESESGESLVG